MKKLNNHDYTTLEKILLVPDMSKTRLSEILGISVPGVFKIINKLRSKNLISDETVALESKGGRPRVSLQINKDYKLLVGFFLSNNSLTSTVTKLNGEIIEVRTRKRNSQLLQVKLINVMVDEIEFIISKYGKENIAGIGISVPGIVDYNNGIVLNSSLFTGKNIKLAEYVETTFKIPCLVGNNVRSVLMAEKLLGTLKNHENSLLLFLNSETSIGISMLINRSIYQGVNFSAGNLNDTYSNTDIPLGKYCDIDEIIKRLSNVYHEEIPDDLNMEKIIELANNCSTPYIEVLEDIGAKIGLALSNVFKILDLGTIVLSGNYFKNNKFISDSLIKTLNKNIGKIEVNVLNSEIEEDIESLAAISLVINNLFSGRKLIK